MLIFSALFDEPSIQGDVVVSLTSDIKETRNANEGPLVTLDRFISLIDTSVTMKAYKEKYLVITEETDDTDNCDHLWMLTGSFSTISMIQNIQFSNVFNFATLATIPHRFMRKAVKCRQQVDT